MARCLNRVSENDVVIQRNAMTILDKLRKAAQGGGVKSAPRHTRIPKNDPYYSEPGYESLIPECFARPR